MTKQELEEKIAKGESVWLIDLYTQSIKEYSNLMHVGSLIYGNDSNGTSSALSARNTLNRLFNIKGEAEHYLRHRNITRTETLPFLTWEEFKDGKMVEFFTVDFKEIRLRYDWWMHQIVLEIGPYDRKIFDNTEENFYKAYDECVKLFLGEGE